MIAKFILCLLVGFAAASDYAWKKDTEYQYQVRGRTLTSLHQVDNQYTGVVLKAQLSIRQKEDGVLVGKIQNTQYAQVHARLPSGWKSEIPDSQLNWRKMPITQTPFEIKLKNGTVQELTVEKGVSNWEANIIKSIVSQIQVDVQGENMIKSRYNQPAEHMDNSATFKTMEDTVTGKCETLYDINSLAEYVLQSKPELAPLPHLKGDGEFIDIVKTRNYSNCDEHVGYHWGLKDLDDNEPGSSHMGDFFLKTSVSHIVLTGNLKRHTIQSSVTTNKVVMKPTPSSTQKGLVVSRLNITLVSVNAASGRPEELSQPKRLGNLVYRYNSPFSASNEAREGSQNSEEHKAVSSGSSSSSEEDRQGVASRVSDLEDESIRNRQRRSLRRSSSSSSSSESSSEEEYNKERHQEIPSLTSPPETPLLPYFVGNKGKSIKFADNINIVQEVLKLAKQIGQELQNPDEIPREDTLAKFTILTKLIRVMNVKELQEASREAYSWKSKDQREQKDSWKAFRDAVAQAGTGPALLIIQEWIQSMKIRGENAAQVLVSMGRNARQPTEEYMRTLYVLVTKPEVQQQPLLNDTALLTFAQLARQVYVSNDDSHNQYPVHSFGKFQTERTKQIVEKEYIPYLAQQLKKAISEADSHKVLVYIRALGNLGHRQILSVWEPYLEGKEQVSQFQRLWMVVSMDQLVKESPKAARSVLYKIYQNKGEVPQIRVAAVYQLMKTSPPASMLQRMAETTNFDTNNQVNAAVKSAIQQAAQLQSPAYWELSTNAKAAVPLLNPKIYGMQYSKQYLKEYVVDQMKMVYKQHLGYMGSEDSYIPQGLMYSLRANMGGVKRQYINLAAMVSNAEDLVRLVNEQIEDEQPEHHQGNKQQSKWTAESVAKLLNIQPNENEQLEGVLSVGLGTFKRLVAWNNHTIEQIPQLLKQVNAALRQGQEFNYTKLFNPYQMTLSFPTVMGLPFVYTLETPTLISLNGKVQAKTQPEWAPRDNQKLRVPETVNITADIRAVVSSKTQAKLGFITPFDHQHYVAGYDKKVQLNLPLRANIDIDIVNQQINSQWEPLDNENQEILHYSTWPYTAQHDLLQLEPISRIHSAQVIHVRQPKHFETVIGEKSGMAFRWSASSEQKFMDNLWLVEQYKRHGWASIIAPFTEDSLVYNNISITYEDQLSDAKHVSVSMAWNETYESEKGEQQEKFSQLFTQLSSLDEQDERQEYLLKKVSAGISNSLASIYDVSVQFEGKREAEYNATIAIARNEVEKKSRVLFYYSQDGAQMKPYEVALAINSLIPNPNGLDFLYALKFDPTSNVHVQLAFGEQWQTGTKVTLEGKLWKSEERQRYLQKLPMAQQCAEEMKQGNHQLQACRNMTARANFMDRWDVEINYENVTPQARNLTAKLYNAARFLGYYNLDENMFGGNGQPGKLNLWAKFEPDFKSLNVSIQSQQRKTEFKNIRLNDFTRHIWAIHPVFDLEARLMGFTQNIVYRPTCVIDSSAAKTFDNKTFPTDLGKTWHVMMQYRVPSLSDRTTQRNSRREESRFQDEEELDYTVLVRDSGNDKKDIKIVLSNETDTWEINVIPSGSSSGSHSGSHPTGQVIVNGEQIKFDDKQAFDIEELLKVYALPNGEVKINVNDDFYVIYDGQRAKLSTTNSDKFRNIVRGLCGNFDGESTTDFWTPKNCILRNPREFAATYAILDESAQGPARELQARAFKAPCIYREVEYANVISDHDSQSKSHEQKHHSRQESSASCSKHQTQYVEENNGETVCFTIRTLPVCGSPCKATKKIVKNVDVHCVPKSNVSDLWKKQIQKGASPDFSIKPVTKTIKIKVAVSCA